MGATDACGKTSSLVYATMYAVKQLLGKKDAEGHNPKILVCSKNITFLAKTWTNAFEQNLRNTNSVYSYDKAKNIIVVGNVEILLVGLEDPTTVYGYSVCCFKEGTKVLTSKGEKNIEDITEEDYVLTRKGFKKVKRAWCSGVKDCIEVNVEGSKITCTPDHRFIDSFNNEIEAKDLTKTTSLVKIDAKEWRKWLKANGETEGNPMLLTSMVSGTTDTLNLNLTEKGVITRAQMETRKKVIQLCTEICGLLNMVKFQKGTTYTIKTETVLTMLLRTLNLLPEASIQKSTGGFNLNTNASRLLSQLKRLRNVIKNLWKTQSTEKGYVAYAGKLQENNILNVSVNAVEKSLMHMLSGLCIVLPNVKDRLQTKGIEDTCTEAEGSREYVSCVEENTKQTNMPELKRAHLTAKTSSVVGRYRVYDIEVENCHEFFANGVLVHNCCIVDELDELPTAVAMEAVKSVNDRVRQTVEGFRDPFICFATTSQGLKGLYQTVLHFKKSGIGYVLMRARTKDNTFLPADYVKNLYAIYNEKERRCLLEGEFISIDSGLVFPDYDAQKNLLDVDLFDTVQPEETVYIGQDFNSFGNAGVACVVRKGAIVIIKDYDIQDIRKAPSIFRYDFPLSKIVWIPDATYSAHFSEFKKELRAYNITIAYRKTNPLVQDRNFAINKLLFIERMYLCPIATNMEKAFLTHQKDPRTGQPTKGGVGAPDHWSDCLGYVAHYILCWDRSMKPLYDVTLGRIYEKRRARGADAVELEVSTQLITAEKLRTTAVQFAPNVTGEEESSAS